MAGLPVAVVGAGMLRFGELFDLSYEDMIVGAYRACLASVDKGIDEDRIQAAWLGTCAGSLIRQEIVTGASLAEPIRFFPRPVTRIENACCTGSDAVRNAAFAIAAGVYDVVLVVGAEKMRDVPSRDSLIRQTSVMFHEWWAPRGATAPNRFGQFATAHMAAYGTERRHMAMIAEKNHHHGSLNPHSFFQREVSCEQVLAAPIVSWPLGLLDCCPTTDGAAAVVLTHADIAHEFSDHPIYLRGSGLATDPLISSWKKEFTAFPATTTAAQEAYRMAGIGPQDVDLAEVHDCFTITELITYEDLGFCEKGAGKDWVDREGPMLGGERPVNTSGGLKAKGHPIGATGVSQVVELWEQLRGEAGERQVDGARVGITHNMGGIGTVVLVNVLASEPGGNGR
jgi:acetyl-CoA C-acetyltransferase